MKKRKNQLRYTCDRGSVHSIPVSIARLSVRTYCLDSLLPSGPPLGLFMINSRLLESKNRRKNLFLKEKKKEKKLSLPTERQVRLSPYILPYNFP
jgi:hypothetical protein